MTATDRKSYAQDREDLAVAKLFPSDFKGAMLEIGAWHPEHFSNSRYFIEAGWSATLIEFSPKPVHELLMQYGYRDNIRIIQAAITAGEEPVLNFEMTENALSSNSPEHNARWKDQSCNYYGHMWVPTLSVRKLLDQFYGDSRFQYASVDTEGSSVPIAIAIMETDWRPEVLCVEFDDSLAYLQTQAQRHGYKSVFTNSTNVVLSRI